MGLGGLTFAASFTVLVLLDAPRIAAAVLLLVPLAGLAIRTRAAVRYLGRHVSIEAVGHLVASVWAAGVAAVVASAGDLRSAQFAAAIAGGAAIVSAAEWVEWARFPVELASDRLPVGAVSPGRRRIGSFASRVSLLVSASMAAVLALIVVGGSGSRIAVSLGVVAAIYVLYALARGMLIADRVANGDDPLRSVIGLGVLAVDPEVLIHFSGSVQALYQLDQWVPFIVSSGRRAVLVVRELPVFEDVAGRWDLPTVFIGPFPDLDLVVTPGVRVALYVNTGTKNNQLIRFPDITHVQIHHGESDKPFASSKTMRLYDHHLVAGPAASERLVGAGVVGRGDVSIVGRPQVAGIVAGPLGHAKPVVLYAPTWEGYHVDTPFSSVLSMGRRIIESVPESCEVVVRPHPLTGTVDRSVRREMEQLRRSVAVRGRFVEPDDEDLAASLSQADVLIADVSSVLVDFLAADRPAIATNVLGVDEAEFRFRFPTTSWCGVVAEDLAGIGDLFADALGPDSRASTRQDARLRYLGDIADPAGAFHEILARLVTGSAQAE